MDMTWQQEATESLYAINRAIARFDDEPFHTVVPSIREHLVSVRNSLADLLGIN